MAYSQRALVVNRVQAPSSAEGAAVAEACPVAVQSAPRSDREGDPARADATWKRVWSWLLGRSSNAGRQGSVLGGSGIEGEL